MERKWEMKGGGWLTVYREGPRVRMEAVRPADKKGLYKVWLQGEQGKRLLFGTLAPGENGLELRKTMSLGELERSGCWPLVGAECRLAFSFGEPRKEGWYCEQHPEKLLSDPLVKSWVRGPMWCRRSEAGFCLAAPFQISRPVALTGLFCLAKAEKWADGLHLVWRFDAKGRPVN